MNNAFGGVAPAHSFSITIYLGTPHALDKLVHFLTFAMKGITSRMHEIDLHSIRDMLHPDTDRRVPYI